MAECKNSECFQVDIAVLKEKTGGLEEKITDIKDQVNDIQDKVSVLPVMTQGIQNIEKALCEYNSKFEQQSKYNMDLSTQTSSIKTKSTLLWYVVVILIMGTVITKAVAAIF